MDFEILYRLYFRDVYRYVRGLSRDEHLAEEIAQETFARALGAVDRFDGRGDVRAWLFTIARNVWVDHCRRHRRETELPGEDLPGGGDFAGALEDREEVLALHRILHTLPEPYKEVFGLRVLERGINTMRTNTTRFAALSRTQNQPETTKKREDENFVLVFTVQNDAGSLAQTLNIIGAHGYNMRTLRSRPMKGLSWKYFFYVEAEGCINNTNGREMLQELSATCAKLRLVGAYYANNI